METKIFFICIITILFVIGCTNSKLCSKELPNLTDINFGVTFSEPHCQWLFGDTRTPESVLIKIAFDLGIKNYRLEAYWNMIQSQNPEELDTSSLDWQLQIMKECGARTVILCLGRKAPHWPEYHIPAWAQELSEAEFKEKLLQYLSRLIDYYANDSRITHFQIENEPFYSFGETKAFHSRRFKDQEEFLKLEIETVKKHDQLNRPIIITDSGDKSNYGQAIKHADILGLSYYKKNYLKVKDIKLGYMSWQRWLLRLWKGIESPKKWRQKINSQSQGKPVFLIELQAEPWGPDNNKFLTVKESYKTMNPARLRDNVQFVVKSGFKDIYFWGIEWIIWMADKGHPEMRDEIKMTINNKF